MTAIRIQKLTKHYGAVQALRGISLHIEQGQRFGLIGPDGAGKTTLMRILVGLLRPDTGSFVIDELDGATQIAQIKASVGYMPQRFSLYQDLTVAENLAFFGDLFGMDRQELAKRRKRLMEFSRLEPFLQRRAGQLSGGMKQKLALSCALIHTPQVLILDEPTTGVDPLSRREFWSILKELSDNEGVTVLVSTPYMDEAMQCHRIGFLHGGNLLAEGEPQAVIAAYPWRILEVTGPALHESSRQLDRLPGIHSFRVMGDRIRFAVENPDLCRSEWPKSPVWHSEWIIQSGTPDLDDVFADKIDGNGERNDTIGALTGSGNGAGDAAEATDAAGTGDAAGVGCGRMLLEQEAAVMIGETRNPDSRFVVETRDLVKRFGHFTAVDRVTLAVRPGEIFGFLGANGAGKTTTIRILCGLLRASSGYANVAGIDVIRSPESVKPRLGYMSQRFSLYEDIRVRDNLEFFGGVYGLSRRQIRERIAEMGQRTGIGSLLDRTVKDLPTGWKQRLALTAAILHDPGIIFLDEPTGGVDPVSRRSFWDLIYDLAQAGKTIFVTTHFMDEAEYCHRIAIMYRGRILMCDTPGAIRSSQDTGTLDDAFVRLITTEISRDAAEGSAA